MHRIYADTLSVVSDPPVLPLKAAAHLKVVRPRNGEVMEIFDGKGKYRAVRYSSGSLEAASPVMEEPPPREIVLFACITKGSRWDWTIQKATELGVTKIVPVVSDRTIVRVSAAESVDKKERWEKIAAEAARQSDAKWLPEILAPVSFDASLEIVRSTECFTGALLAKAPLAIADAVTGRRGGLPPAVYVGPEGDFTPEELERLLGVSTPVSLGKSILRAETAAIYALSVIKAFFDSSLSAQK